MTEVCAFWEGAVDDAGAVRITGIHHQPHLLPEEQKARGLVLPAMPAEPTTLPSRGHRWALRARPATGEVWWSEERDPAFDPAISPPMLLMRLPSAARIAAKAARGTDAILGDWFDMLDAMQASGDKLRPDDAFVAEGITRMAELGLLSEADAARVTAL